MLCHHSTAKGNVWNILNMNFVFLIVIMNCRNVSLHHISLNMTPTLYNTPKLFTRKKMELKKLINSIRIFSQDIRTEFVMEKCAPFVIRRGKMEGMELPHLWGDKDTRRRWQPQIFGSYGNRHARINKDEREKWKIIHQKNKKIPGNFIVGI